jgi:hypothetical protein
MEEMSPEGDGVAIRFLSGDYHLYPFAVGISGHGI